MSTCQESSGRNIEKHLSRFSSLFSMAQQWSRDMMSHRGGIYFWKTISWAHHFLCSATPIQNYFFQFTIYTSATCSGMKKLTCSGSEWQQFSRTPALLTHMWTPPLQDILIPILRAHVVMREHQGLYKGVICTREEWSYSCSCFILHLCLASISNLLRWIESYL